MTKKKSRDPLDLDPILRAASRLFRQQGYANTSLRQIAAAAGILPGSLHYRFKSKEDLLIALAERAVDTGIARVREAMARSRDPLERIRLGMQAHLSMLLSGEDSVYVLLYEWRSLAGAALERMVRLRDRYDAFCEGILYEAAGSLRVREGTDLRLVRLFGFGAMNWVAQWYKPGGDRSPEQIADAFWAYMAFGIVSEDQRPEGLTDLMTSLSALEPAGAE